MARKFESGEQVTILGTDRARATIVPSQPTNSDLVLVGVHNIQAVYPYYGSLRVYPESMLEKVNG